MVFGSKCRLLLISRVINTLKWLARVHLFYLNKFKCSTDALLKVVGNRFDKHRKDNLYRQLHCIAFVCFNVQNLRKTSTKMSDIFACRNLFTIKQNIANLTVSIWTHFFSIFHFCKKTKFTWQIEYVSFHGIFNLVLASHCQWIYY